VQLGNAIDWAADRALGAARSFGRGHLKDAGESVAARVGPPPGTIPDPALPSMIWIRYQNEGGGLSERTVTLRQAWREGNEIHLIAWCHMERAVRHFEASRIRELVDLASGERAESPPKWLEQHALLFEGAENDDTMKALRATRDELALLLYLARADGVLDRDEIELAIDHVAGSTEAPISRLRCTAYIRRLAPDPDDLPAVLDRVTADPERWARLRHSAQRLAQAGGVSDVEEAAWKEIGDQAEAAAARKAEFVRLVGRSGLADVFAEA